MTTTSITDVRTIGVSVTNQDAAISFYLDKLGFEKRLFLIPSVSVRVPNLVFNPHAD